LGFPLQPVFDLSFLSAFNPQQLGVGPEVWTSYLFKRLDFTTRFGLGPSFFFTK
jgi:hypothetical protein